MYDKASDLTYDLNVIGYQFSVLEVHHQQKKLSIFIGWLKSYYRTKAVKYYQ